MSNFYAQVDSNKLKSNLVIAGFMLFIAGAAYAMTYAFDLDYGFIGIALIFAGLTSLGSYYYSDRIILSLSNAKPATREEHFNFYTVAENLSLAAQLPLPKLYVIEDSAINAFATGRDPKHAVVVATTGLLSRLNRTELEGVVAHELSHVKNYDIRLMSLVAVLVGTVTLLADMLLRMSFYGGRSRERSNSGQAGVIIAILGVLLMILSPIIANLIKLAISRRREFLADASAAAITKYPEGLAMALEKIAQDREPLEAANKATAHLYISNPLKNHHDAIGWFSNLFSTHPPVEARITALRGK
jgi:heat shock protein HtpX